METISITELTDTQWQQYFEMTQELSRRYYPEFYDTTRTVKEVKDEIRNDHVIMQKYNRESYLLYDNSKAIGRFNYSQYHLILGWDFDLCLDIIPDVMFLFILHTL